ncbi:MAG: hypothetical protein J0I75_09990 [Hyphomicrobium sp.]|nr:hypothetical protein [Hyphomicrobium sp.]
MAPLSARNSTGCKARRSPIGADSSDVLYRLAAEDLGIVCLGELAVASALSNGTLVKVLHDFQVQEGYPLWALTPPGRHSSPEIRAFMEFLAQCLGRSPWRASLAKLRK